MTDRRKYGIIHQIRKPILIFLIIFITLETVVLLLYNLQHYILMRHESASELGNYSASVMQEYSSIGWLTEYWLKHNDEMELFYSEDTIDEKEKELLCLLPNGATVHSVLPEDIERLDESGQCLMAEVCYAKIAKEFDRLKESFQPLYLYSFEVNDDEMLFLATGTREGETRISEGGDIFEIGYTQPYIEGVYPVLDEILRTKKPVSGLETSLSPGADRSAVHVFVPVFQGKEIVALVGVSLPWKDLLVRGIYISVLVGGVTAVLFIMIGVLTIRLLRRVVVSPIGMEQEIIREYEKEKDSARVVEGLSQIRTDNEIEALADSFSSMVGELDRYIEEIRAVTAEKERIGAELSVATQIQADMLPSIFPAFPERKEFDIYATMNPAKEVGGDFYDFFLVDEDHLAMVMADVSGKGVPAALFMVIAKTLIKNRTQMGGTPAEILGDVNEQLCEGNEAELFVTVWLAILEISTGKGIAANAGHEHPVLKRAGEEYELIQYRHSPAVATMEGIRFREHEFELHPGDMLYVYTDGVAEATNASDELYGTERMLEVLNANKEMSVTELLPAVRKDIESFAGDAPQFDDITMLGFAFFGKGGNEDA